MFDTTSRYKTAGVESELPLQLQVLLWEMIDELKKEIELDYLQVFELSVVKDERGTLQKIEHRQEQPEYKKSYVLPYSEPVKLKIFVIDDQTHSTMLLAEEY